MKHWLVLALLCAVLTGCGVQPQEETTTGETTTVPPTSSEVPTEPTGCYDPASEAELITKGAVRAYPLNIENAYGFTSMDGAVVVFSGEEDTQLTRLSGDNLYITASASLGFTLYPEDPSVTAGSQGMTYYDCTTYEMVILDSSLREVSRIKLPETVVGSPVMAPDRMHIYYCTPDAVRVLEVDTGIHRLLKEMSFDQQTMRGVWMEGSILECAIQEEDGTLSTLFLSSKDGSLIWELDEWTALEATGNRFYTSFMEGRTQNHVFGTEEAWQTLLPREYTSSVFFLEDCHGAVSVHGNDSMSWIVLDYYDLDSGVRVSTLELGPGMYPYYICCDSTSGDVLVMRYDDSYDRETIFRWDVDALPVEDDTDYTTDYYSSEAPDLAGLAECEAYAEEIGDRYGIDIELWQEALEVQPWDYSMVGEYRVPALKRSLSQLEALLEAYPKGMLEMAVQGTTEGDLTICLVREIVGNPESGNLDQAEGLQFWQEEDAYVVLTVDSDLNLHLYHEISHVLETRILSKCTAFYEWETLNPEGFEYDYDYVANLSREPGDYLSGDTRAFIDTYSMSFPNEDRARIMEYAMNPDNELYFQSEIMQEKLSRVCAGIREAFGLKDGQGPFLWEQYLQTE